MIIWAGAALVNEKKMVFVFLVEDEGATPVKRRRVSSDDDRDGDTVAAPLCVAGPSSSSSTLPACVESKSDHQEALTPTSTSDTETRDSSSLIDPGTEQDPPSPEPVPTSSTSENPGSSPKEEKMEASSSSSSSSSSFSSSSSSSLLPEAGEGLVQGEEPEAPRLAAAGEAEREGAEPQVEDASTSSQQAKQEEEEAELKNCAGLAPPLSDDAIYPSSLGLMGEGPEGCGGHAPASQVLPPPDMLDLLHRTVEAAIAIVSKLSVKGPPPS